MPNTKGLTVSVEISPGELIDKITILEIKAARIGDTKKLANVRHELGVDRAAHPATRRQAVVGRVHDSVHTELRDITVMNGRAIAQGARPPAENWAWMIPRSFV